MLRICTLVFLHWLGNLSSVTGLKATNGSTLNWTAPFSLDVTDVDPDIWYSVLIYNVTDEDNPTAIPCTDCTNITETHYTFTPEDVSPCQNVSFSVIPFNGAGQGETSQNVTGYVLNSKPWCAFVCSMRCGGPKLQLRMFSFFTFSVHYYLCLACLFELY